MKLVYNGFDFGSLGKVVFASDKGEAFPKEGPANYRRTVTARVLTNQPGYVENFGLIEQGRQALRVTNGLLQFTDDAGETMVERNVTVLGHDWPDQPNAWGNYHQVLEFDFEYTEPLELAQSGTSSVTLSLGPAGGTGNGPKITLTGIERCKDMLHTERYDALRKQRKMVDNRIELSGKHRAGAELTQADRRTALLTELAAFKAVVRSGAELVMTYGGVVNGQPVRVEDFQAEVDQASWSIAWSLTVRYTDFPNEAGYAQCEFTVGRREDKGLGTQVVTLSGAVAAQTELAAKAKWKTVRAAVLGNGPLGDVTGYALVKSDSRPEQIDGADGAAFIKVTFEEEWQKQSGNLLSWDVRMSDGEETQSGMRPRTYSGSVTATGADEVTAYTAAVAQAKTLAEGKWPILRSSRIEWVSRLRQTVADADAGLPGNVLVTVEFNYVYEVKSSRVYYQLTNRAVIDTWGQDTTEVSGTIAALDGVGMLQVYQSEIVSLYAGRLLRNHQFGLAKEGMGGLTAQGDSDGKYITQWQHADFSFVVLEPKASATVRYEMEAVKDYEANTLTTRVTGTVWAASGDVVPAASGQPEDAATVYLESFLSGLMAGLSVGTKRLSRRTASAEVAGTLKVSGEVNGGPAQTNFTGLNFEEVWSGPLTGNAAIVKCSLRETINPSGNRVVPQATAQSTPVIQICGQTEGTRAVRGTVTGTSQAACEAWIKRQKTVPLPAGMTTTGGRASTAVQVDFNTVFVDNLPVPVGAGDWPVAGQRPDGTKVQMVEAEFSFTEYFEQLGGGGWN